MSISASADVEVVARPYQWELYDGGTDKRGVDNGGADNGNLRILAWCLGRQDEKILLRIEDFPATCMLQLPMFVGGVRFKWTAGSAAEVVETLSRRLAADDHAPIPFRPSDFWAGWDKLYYYNGDRKYPHVMLNFRTENAMRHARTLVRNPIEVEGMGYLKLNLWETEVKTIVKLLAETKIHHCSWLRASGEQVPVDDQISDRPLEYVVRWTSIQRIPESESGTWRTYPTIMAYDIEQYSHKTLQFPKPNCIHDHVFLNCLDFYKLGTKERHRYAILYGDCADIEPDKIANLTLIKVRHETDIQMEMARLMKLHDPQILIGYNNEDYDNTVLNARLEINGENWPVLGCLKGRPGRLISNDWNSSGAGFNSINTFYAPGRINMDMLQVVKREGYKFRDYGLDFVSRRFLNGRGKHDMPAWRMFEIYEAMRASMKAHHPARPPNDDPGMVGMRDMLYYCVNDSELVIDLFVKLNVWIGSVEMSNVAGVTIEDFYSRGQQQRCMSNLYRIAKKRNIVLDTKATSDIPYQGGAVCDPVPGYHPYVICEDFESLYPSIINANNLCYTTLIEPSLVDRFAPEDVLTLEIDCDELLRQQDQKRKRKAPVITKSYGILKLSFYRKKRGVMPDLAKKLIMKRRVVKAEIKVWSQKLDEKEDYLELHQATLSPAEIEALKVEIDAIKVELTRLDKKQLALKIINNSLYGFTAARDGGQRPLVELAMATTFLGRSMIGACNKYLKETYGAMIAYGDTDSTMVVMPPHLVSSNQECITWGKRLAGELTALFPTGINMTYEKSMRAIFIKKKNYIYAYLDDKDDLILGRDGQPILEVKGALPARRDNATWACDIYLPVAKLRLTGGTMEQALEILFEGCFQILEGRVPLDELVITKTMGANYKSETATMRVFGDELRRLGRPAQPGDRLSYVIVKTPNKDEKMGKKMMLKSMYVDQQVLARPPELDYPYYIQRMLRKHFDNMFCLAFREEIQWLSQFEDTFRRPNRQCKLTGLNDIVFTIGRLVEGQSTVEAGLAALRGYYQTIKMRLAQYRRHQLEERLGFVLEEDDDQEMDLIPAGSSTGSSGGECELGQSQSPRALSSGGECELGQSQSPRALSSGGECELGEDFFLEE